MATPTIAAGLLEGVTNFYEARNAGRLRKKQEAQDAEDRKYQADSRAHQQQDWAYQDTERKKKPLQDIAAMFNTVDYQLTRTPEEQQADLAAYNKSASELGLPTIPRIRDAVAPAMHDELEGYMRLIPNVGEAKAKELARNGLIAKYGQDRFAKFMAGDHLAEPQVAQQPVAAVAGSTEEIGRQPVATPAPVNPMSAARMLGMAGSAPGEPAGLYGQVDPYASSRATERAVRSNAPNMLPQEGTGFSDPMAAMLMSRTQPSGAASAPVSQQPVTASASVPSSGSAFDALFGSSINQKTVAADRAMLRKAIESGTLSGKDAIDWWGRNYPNLKTPEELFLLKARPSAQNAAGKPEASRKVEYNRDWLKAMSGDIGQKQWYQKYPGVEYPGLSPKADLNRDKTIDAMARAAEASARAAERFAERGSGRSGGGSGSGGKGRKPDPFGRDEVAINLALTKSELANAYKFGFSTDAAMKEPNLVRRLMARSDVINKYGRITPLGKTLVVSVNSGNRGGAKKRSSGATATKPQYTKSEVVTAAKRNGLNGAQTAKFLRDQGY